MSDYRKVSEALAEGADPDMLCMTCPWDRFCLTPPSMTRDEIDRQMEDAKRKDEEDRAKAEQAGEKAPMPVTTLVTALATGGRDTQASICPVLALRLRTDEGGKIVQQVRSYMRADQ